jgi:2-amino-4-hydroxy-6-hydroxymethyldihydropteridine diphosphokinase
VTTAYLALGSNLGDRWGHLRRAAAQLREIDPQLGASSVYETAPVGGPEGQRPYLNCVVRMSATLEPLQLLAVAHRLENQAGRVRSVRDGPRTLDVDILLAGSIATKSDELTIPHPRMYERGFVLAPLEELDPALVPPGWRSTIPGAERLAEDVRRVGTLWPAD